jgi:hypothetical protein
VNLDTDNIFARSFLRSLSAHILAEKDLAKGMVGGRPQESSAFGDICNLAMPVPKESSASSSSSSRAPSSRAPAARGGRPFETDYVAMVGRPLVGRASKPGTTGRCGMSGADFTRIGGYDQDCHGAGYQDIDLIDRANLCLKLDMQHDPAVKVMRKKLDATKARVTGQGCGTCLKNFPETMAGPLTPKQQQAQENFDRDAAKIVNIHPCSIQECGNWHMMNDMNKINMTNKLRQGKIVRNMGYDTPLWHLGEHELLLKYLRSNIGPCRPEQG